MGQKNCPCGESFVAITSQRYCSVACRVTYRKCSCGANLDTKANSCRRCSAKKTREIHLQREYEMSLGDYDALLALQGEVCAICGKGEKRLTKDGESVALAVDHDHESNTVRGLLCYNCNAGIGFLSHNPANLINAIRYLTIPPTRQLHLLAG